MKIENIVGICAIYAPLNENCAAISETAPADKKSLAIGMLSLGSDKSFPNIDGIGTTAVPDGAGVITIGIAAGGGTVAGREAGGASSKDDA
jgi:hypothetical protein